VNKTFKKEFIPLGLVLPGIFIPIISTVWYDRSPKFDWKDEIVFLKISGSRFRVQGSKVTTF
jgi:hypothetical protein